MSKPRPGKLPNAIRARFFHAKKEGIRASQSIVVYRLDDRNTSVGRRIINARAEKWENIVDMNDVREEIFDCFAHQSIAAQ
jgi:hypothetical protein